MEKDFTVTFCCRWDSAKGRQVKFIPCRGLGTPKHSSWCDSLLQKSRSSCKSSGVYKGRDTPSGLQKDCYNTIGSFRAMFTYLWHTSLEKCQFSFPAQKKAPGYGGGKVSLRNLGVPLAKSFPVLNNDKNFIRSWASPKCLLPAIEGCILQCPQHVALPLCLAEFDNDNENNSTKDFKVTFWTFSYLVSQENDI